MSNGEPSSLEQKKKFHAMVRDIAQQVEWAGERMDEAEWKLLLLAAAHGQDVVPNPFDPSRFLIRNKKRLRDLAMPTTSELITQMFAFGNERGVKWTDPAIVAEMRAAEEEVRRWSA